MSDPTVIDFGLSGGWYFLAKQASDGVGWYGFAKREPFVRQAHFVEEPGEVHFGNWRATAQAAIDAVRDELPALTPSPPPTQENGQ